MSAAMKPILFSTPMVQAILDGRKTMTRRVCNIPDGWEYNGWGRITSKHPKQGKLGIFIRKQDGDFVLSDIITAKYQVGDVLWVRETTWEVDCDCQPPWCCSRTFGYRADEYDFNGVRCSVKTIPSIFMPKEACRIFLRVTNVRVERLQDMPHDDVYAEGFPDDFYKKGGKNFRHWFVDLWNSINGKGAWESNPFVFVYEFERVEKPC